jgi:phage tail-like protein
MARRDSSHRADPYLECFFGIELSIRGQNYQKEGTSSGAYFTKIEGGEMEITVLEHQVVYNSGRSSTLYIPGPAKYKPITLYQGVTDDTAMWSWWRDVAMGRNVRKDASIIIYGQDVSGTMPTSRWELEKVWPMKISGLNLDLDSGNAMIAAITVVAESIIRIPGDTLTRVLDSISGVAMGGETTTARGGTWT